MTLGTCHIFRRLILKFSAHCVIRMMTHTAFLNFSFFIMVIMQKTDSRPHHTLESAVMHGCDILLRKAGYNSKDGNKHRYCDICCQSLFFIRFLPF